MLRVMPTVSDHDLRITIMRLARRVRLARSDAAATDGQFSVLFTLHSDGPQTLRSLSDSECVTPPSMNRTINALQDAGLISRQAAPDDGRKVTIDLTGEGVAMVKETRRKRDEWFSTRLAALTPEQRAILADAAPILTELANS
jgi:DNA-binding MarR family transcriptional regulator